MASQHHRPRHGELEIIHVQHIVSQRTLQGVVQLCAEGDVAHLNGQISPDEARALAVDLMRAAARADYESDFITRATAEGLDQRAIGAVVHIIRNGEFDREATKEVQGDGPPPSTP